MVNRSTTSTASSRCSAWCGSRACSRGSAGAARSARWPRTSTSRRGCCSRASRSFFVALRPSEGRNATKNESVVGHAVADGWAFRDDEEALGFGDELAVGRRASPADDLAAADSVDAGFVGDRHVEGSRAAHSYGEGAGEAGVAGCHLGHAEEVIESGGDETAVKGVGRTFIGRRVGGGGAGDVAVDHDNHGRRERVGATGEGTAFGEGVVRSAGHGETGTCERRASSNGVGYIDDSTGDGIDGGGI